MLKNNLYELQNRPTLNPSLSGDQKIIEIHKLSLLALNDALVHENFSTMTKSDYDRLYDNYRNSSNQISKISVDSKKKLSCDKGFIHSLSIITFMKNIKYFENKAVSLGVSVEKVYWFRGHFIGHCVDYPLKFFIKNRDKIDCLNTHYNNPFDRQKIRKYNRKCLYKADTDMNKTIIADNIMNLLEIVDTSFINQVHVNTLQ